jgi:ABC-type uncharacterized transport system substrate-binding protein
MKRMVTMCVLLVVAVGMFANLGFAAEMKKVVILYPFSFDSLAQYVLKGLEQAGFVASKNLTSVQIEVSATTDPVAIVTQVREAAPDVVIDMSQFGQFIEALNELDIPMIKGNSAEHYVNAEGVPVANVTGLYTTLKDMVYNSYRFLQKVAPLKPGQQAVLLDVPQSPLIRREEVVDALQRLQIPLKAIVDTTIYEDWQAAILKYNEDPDVGWILYGVGLERKRDGSKVDSFTDIYPWDREHLKKPKVAYWEIVVREGALCGFGIDVEANEIQVGQMAARVLQGEPIQSIKAEYPGKVMIALNRKTATNLGITFSMDVLKLANVIYNDYEGKDVIRK